MKIQNNINLQNYNTFKVAAIAKHFCEAFMKTVPEFDPDDFREKYDCELDELEEIIYGSEDKLVSNLHRFACDNNLIKG
jgi:hypothetical protein